MSICLTHESERRLIIKFTKYTQITLAKTYNVMYNTNVM